MGLNQWTSIKKHIPGNKPLELRIHRKHRAVLYASDPALLDAVLAEERGWRELSVPPMSMIVFRHEVLTEFSSSSSRKRGGRHNDRACNEPR